MAVAQRPVAMPAAVWPACFTPKQTKAPTLETEAGLLPTRLDGEWFEVDMGKIEIIDTNALIEGGGYARCYPQY